MTSIYGLVGASGFGSEVMPILEQNMADIPNQDSEIFFIDSDESKKIVNSKKVLSEDNFFNFDSQKKFYNVSISNPKIRKEICQRFEQRNINTFSIISQDNMVVHNVIIGKGAIILPHVLLTSNISIGDFFSCNPKCSIAHDVIIGDYVTLAPGALINGNVSIGDCAYIGSGSVIKQGIEIGSGAIVGMGAVVTKNVAPNSTVVGNPAVILNNYNENS